MATQLDTAHLLGISAILDVGGETVSIGGLHYKAVVGTIEERDELAEGGVRQIRSVQIAIPAAAFNPSFEKIDNAPPSIWTRITVRGQELQVLSVNRDEAVVEITAGGLAE
jgi:hypothetical protein